MEGDLEDEICPDDMENKKDGEETIEYVVSGEHFHHLWGLYCCTEKDPSWKESEPGENPSNNKNSKDDITGSVQLGVVEHLGKLEEDIREVVYKKDQSSTPGEIAGPRERQESYGGQVVDEHFYKVFSSDVKELGEGERPVEGQLEHIVPPHRPLYVMVGVVVP